MLGLRVVVKVSWHAPFVMFGFHQYLPDPYADRCRICGITGNDYERGKTLKIVEEVPAWPFQWRARSES